MKVKATGVALPVLPLDSIGNRIIRISAKIDLDGGLGIGRRPSPGNQQNLYVRLYLLWTRTSL